MPINENFNPPMVLFEVFIESKLVQRIKTFFIESISEMCSGKKEIN